MVELIPSGSQVLLAQKKAKALGSLNNSIRNGEGNAYGFLGEILVSEYINAPIDNTFDYDIVKNNIKIDVKTKCCTSKPLSNYFCSVAAFNITQKCDVYVFVRVLEDFSKAWVLGGRTKNKFFEEAKFYKAGELDPSSNYGWTFRADCYNMEVGKLKPLDKLRK